MISPVFLFFLIIMPTLMKVGDYMHKVQRDLVPSHRKIVTDWMLEVGLYNYDIGGWTCYVECYFLKMEPFFHENIFCQVTEEQECSPQVFLSAVQYLDRVLACLPIKRSVGDGSFIRMCIGEYQLDFI